MRKDAQKNRDRLIVAARDVMRNEGADAPMELIAERANVTRATLYRNFAHRQDMYQAVLEDDLQIIVARLDVETKTDPFAFIRRMAELIMVYDKFLIALVDMGDYDAEKSQLRMKKVIAAPLAAAQASGRLHPRLTGDDILMACRMLASHWKLDDEPDFDKTFAQRFSLMMQGLGPPTSAPPPQRVPRKNEPPK